MSGPIGLLGAGVVAFALIYPGASFTFNLVIPVTARSMLWLTVALNVLFALYYVPRGVTDPIAWIASS